MRDLRLAGFGSAPADVQTYFLSTSNDFQDAVKKAFVTGNMDPTQITVKDLQQQWENWQDSEGESDDSSNEQEYTKDDVL